jgi:hypothetical protein
MRVHRDDKTIRVEGLKVFHDVVTPDIWEVVERRRALHFKDL